MIRILSFSMIACLVCASPASGQDAPPNDNERPILRLETGGHTSGCTWLSFTPDGKTLVSGGLDKVIRFWDVSRPSEPRLQRSFRLQIGPGSVGAIFAGDISPDGRWLAVSTTQPRLTGALIHILSVPAGNVVTLLRGHDDLVHFLEFSPDGKWLASAGADNTVRVWSATGWDRGVVSENLATAVLRGHTEMVRSVRWQEDVNQPSSQYRLVSGSRDDTARIWAQNADKSWESFAILTGHANGVNEVACSSDGRWVLTSSGDGTIHLWDRDGKFERVLGTAGLKGEVLQPIDFSADGQLAVGATGKVFGGTRVWSIPDGRLVSRFDGHDSLATAARFCDTTALTFDTSEDSALQSIKLLATAGGQAADIYLMDATTGKQLGHIDGRGDTVLSAAFSPDGKRIAWGNVWGVTPASAPPRHRNPLTLEFDLIAFRSPEPSRTSVGAKSQFAETDWLRGPLTTDGLSATLSHQMDNQLAIHRNDRTISRVIRQEDDAINCYAFIRGQDLIVVNSNQGLALHDVKSGEIIRVFGGPSLDWAVASSPDGRTLLSAGSEQILRLWSLEDLPGRRKLMGLTIETTNDAAVVKSVFPSFPAANAGIIAGDIVTHLNSSPVSTIEQVNKIVSATDAGDVVDVKIKRGNAIRDLQLVPIDQQMNDTVAPLLSLFVTKDGKEWVAWTEEGYYAASPGGEELIGWHVNQGIENAAKFTTASQLRRIYYRPDVVSRVLEARSTERALELANEERHARPQGVVDVRSERDKLAVPEIRLTVPAEESRTPNKSVRLTGVVVPTGTLPLTEVRVTVNGRPIPGFHSKNITIERTNSEGPDDLPEGARHLDVDVPLVPGANQIEVIALTEYATTRPARREVFRESRVDQLIRPSLYAISIGTSEHENKDFNLQFADDDARGVFAALQKQQDKLYGKVEGRLLIDADVTERNVRKEMTWLRAQVTQHDLAIVFVSGHGVTDSQGNFYYVPHDFDGDPTVTGIPWTQFMEPLAGLPCKVLLCMDTCHSAGVLRTNAGNAKGPKPIEQALDLVLREMTAIEVGLVVMTSSTGREFSLEHPDWGHGAFALALIEGLTGDHIFAPESSPPKTQLPADLNKDGVIEIKELDLYVTQRVREVTAGAQHPVTRSGDIPSFPVATAK